jgi:hypothetical protein
MFFGNPARFFPLAPSFSPFRFQSAAAANDPLTHATPRLFVKRTGMNTYKNLARNFSRMNTYAITVLGSRLE